MDLDIISGINQFLTEQPSLSYIPLGTCIIIGLAASYYQVSKRTRLQPVIDNGNINTPDKPKLVIEAGLTERQYWHDLWRYRELFYFLAWRDILVRYKQTIIGVAWAVLRPLLTMIVFSVIFGKLAKLPSDGVPYPIMVFAAMLPWQFFANALSECSNSLISNANLVSKVYFPRLIVPTSAVVVSFIDFLISSSILVALMIWYQFVPTWGMLMLPFLILLAFAAALGGGLWFTALNIKYRDFRFIVPFVVQFGLYVSPVGFSSNIVPEQWRLLYSLNPMVGVIDGFRWAILGQDTAIYWPGFLLSVGIVACLLISGIWYFRKTERTFADII
ncbi:ABC transporter permease [Methylobacter sp. BBA5.1]|uniref:ABC transporter permease n=1 Tax=Methylobacter sp. BBA5.1 TaxID=1495064 RepID=UPI000A9F1709|nr:ABC transporter permease [Methylobacter sp. BBA5.1]